MGKKIQVIWENLWRRRRQNRSRVSEFALEAFDGKQVFVE